METFAHARAGGGGVQGVAGSPLALARGQLREQPQHGRRSRRNSLE
ncbi:MAG: hypothetical protein MZV64_36095 [Ignavibacteriales bacterium]|nr:hypothetical protein [Ignavibacteriales bacterium]